MIYFYVITMRWEDMSWEDIKKLSPHLRVIAEDAKKAFVLKQSWYKTDSDLPSWCEAFFGITIIVSIVLVVWLIVIF